MLESCDRATHGLKSAHRDRLAQSLPSSFLEDTSSSWRVLKPSNSLPDSHRGASLLDCRHGRMSLSLSSGERHGRMSMSLSSGGSFGGSPVRVASAHANAEKRERTAQALLLKRLHIAKKYMYDISVHAQTV
jgi:endonuclease/exonuclease/phosphatase family metal-dependent hydrolase